MTKELNNEYLRFAILWSLNWSQYFRRNPFKDNKNQFKVEKVSLSNTNKFPCLHLIGLINPNKNYTTNRQAQAESQSNIYTKSIYYISNKDNDYRKIIAQYSRLRKRELKFAEKNYLCSRVSKTSAIDLLKSYQYKEMHYQFYKSFPSPELPIDLLILLINKGLTSLTAYYTIKEKELIGATFSCIVGTEYYIPFVIYTRNHKSHKGITTYMWSMQIEHAFLGKCRIVNLGTSPTESNVAKFIKSLGGQEFPKNHIRKKLRLLDIIVCSKIVTFILNRLPKKLFGLLGFLAYKYFGNHI